MMFFLIAVLVCIFIGDDFKSGYVKNLFTVRAKKSDYVISKTLICSLGAGLTFIALFFGAVIGGKVAGLPFMADGLTSANVFFCLLSKILLTPVFVSIFALMSVIGKQKNWLSMCLSLGVGMLLYMMIPSLTPLNSTLLNVFISILSSAIIGVGLGVISNKVLQKTSLL
jgi:ABC-2 type transport system permease protein